MTIERHTFPHGILRYPFGSPIATDAVVLKPSPSVQTAGPIPGFSILPTAEGWEITIALHEEDILWGLGEQMGGFNKKGRKVVMYNTDEFQHTPDKKSLYGSHPFLMIFEGPHPLCFFLDHPGKTLWDLGFSDPEKITIQVPKPGFDLYTFPGKKPDQWVPLFIALTGKSILPPRWSFGYHQSRWGYASAQELADLADRFDKEKIPVDMIAMDIDYMDHFKVFTFSPEGFPEPQKAIEALARRGIKVVPIIDPGVKVEKGYKVYEEGLRGQHFIHDSKGQPFLGQVWPGWTHFPDFQRPQTRTWWGSLYKEMLEIGIEGFWNDMNEPALFFTPAGVHYLREQFKEFEEKQDQGVYNFFAMKQAGGMISNNEMDYQNMIQEDPEIGPVTLHSIHNLYGHNMSRATREGMEKHAPKKRTLLFSRASYAGGQRYGGVWTGDNKSWWEHILLNLQMVANLNMAGWIYSGADLGGFGDDCYGELLVRWTQLGIFMPLMRNHSALGTRSQEPFALDTKTLRRTASLIRLRYRLIPHLYSQFLLTRDQNKPLIRPLGYEFSDPRSLGCEDQALWGEGVMIAPVYLPNALGRMVYLPQGPWLEVKVLGENNLEFSPHSQGDHFIPSSQDQLSFFLQENHLFALGQGGQRSDQARAQNLAIIGFISTQGIYTLVEDDETMIEPGEKDRALTGIRVRIQNGQLETALHLEGEEELRSVENIHLKVFTPQGLLLEKDLRL